MKSHKEVEINNKIEEFFFPSSKNPVTYKELFFKNNPNNLEIRFSPLYLITRDIYFCFGLNPEKNNQKICKDFGPAEFAGTLLIFQAIEMLCKARITSKEKFYKEFFFIKDKKLITALTYARNGLTHNFYSPSYKKNGVNWHYKLSIEPGKLIEEKVIENRDDALFFNINHYLLFNTFLTSLKKLKERLLKEENKDLRRVFNDKIRRKHWLIIGNSLLNTTAKPKADPQ